MRIGLVSEIKPAERRVALTDTGVSALVLDGHDVLVERGAGVGAGIHDDAYVLAGAKLVDTAVAWAADLVVKVKEPIAPEYPYLRESTALFTYLHLAADPHLTRALVAAKVTAIAYETVEDDRGGLPLLAPMSEIAGRLAAHAAGHYLMHPYGGPGVLLGGSPGVAPAKVVVLGGGVVGTQAALLAIGMHADVTILDISPRRVRELEHLLGTRATVLQSDPATLLAEVARADVVIGAVLVPGATAPRLVSRRELAHLKPGALLIDVAIDQGGCFETSRATTYDEPTYEIDGIVHYCVANMPGAVPQTSTRALTNATLPYIRRIANLGVDDALAEDPGLGRGLNARAGTLTHDAVAAAHAEPTATAAGSTSS
jgi:alanine dehydrogenase